MAANPHSQRRSACRNDIAMFVRMIRQKKQGERGQSLVEFTLILPIFLVLLFAIVDFGMGFHAWITVTNSAREGARLGAVREDTDDIVEWVYDTANLPNEETNMTVTVECGPGLAPTGSCPSDPGDSVVVDVDYEYDLITPLAGIMGFITGDLVEWSTLTISSTANMRLEPE